MFARTALRPTEIAACGAALLTLGMLVRPPATLPIPLPTDADSAAGLYAGGSGATFNSSQRYASMANSGNPEHISIDYPEDGSIFPPEITAPVFLWHDGSAARIWRVEISFSDRAKPIRAETAGPPPQVGVIDPSCVSTTNQFPSLTPEQASAHSWQPDSETWASIKRHSSGREATVVFTGIDEQGGQDSLGRSSFTTSTDPVGAPIFYRDVPLMPSQGRKGVVQPLAPSQLYLINWRLRDVGQPESRVVLHDLHTCGNCHSFSNDGKTMGMDVDGPGNDKGLYAIVPVQKQMSIGTKDIVSWNTDGRVGQSRVGFMSQVSPDARYVLTTFAGRDQSIESSYFVTNFSDYRFLQVFYPTRGILAVYDRSTGRREPLPGADDPRFVQTDGVWSPDGKWIVFARAEARDPDPPGHPMPARANDANEIQIRYSLYRVPFNNGHGGSPEPIAGASDNGMSNNFPRVSPDGRWVVFVKCRNGQLMRPDSELYIVAFRGGVARRMRCNTSLMNSWHSFSPNGRWLVFSSKSRSPYTQLFLTHIDENGNDSPPIYIENSTAANRAVNIPEFVNIPPDGITKIDVPAANFYRVVDEAMDLTGKGDTHGALARWNEALALDPGDARAQNGRGMALGQSGQFEAAAASFRQAVTIERDFFEGWYNLGLVLTRLNRTDEAISAWENTVRIRPLIPRAHENLGYALSRVGRYSEALGELQQAVDKDPKRLTALLLEARLLATCPEAQLRDGAKAVTLGRRASELTGGTNAVALDVLAEALAEVGQFDAAIAAEREALNSREGAGQGRGMHLAAQRLEAHLKCFEAHQPVHEPMDANEF